MKQVWTAVAAAVFAVGAYAADPIKIGVAGPFPGGSSSMGVSMRDGVRLAADEINKAGGLLLDALGAFLEDFEKIGARLRAADDTFGAAKRRLIDSKMAVIPRAKRLVSLGVKPKGKLPELLAPDADTEIEAFGQTLLKQVAAAPGERDVD